jgi:hypothetical protein
MLSRARAIAKGKRIREVERLLLSMVEEHQDG